jgi:GNAT superfamily N-acetyltransferase
MSGGAMTIRMATQDDVEQITRMVNAAYTTYLDRIEKPPAPMLADYAALIASGGVHVLILGAEIAGVPAFQGQGLGRRLMAFAERYACEHELRELRLYTNEVMVENLAFYQRLGFEEVERRVDDGYHRVFMRKSLAQ